VTQLAAKPVIKRCAYAPDRCGLGSSAPKGQAVGDEEGRLSPNLSDENLHPWCVLRTLPTDLRSETGKPSTFDIDVWFRDTCVGGADCVNGSCNGSDCTRPPECPVGAEVTERAAWDDANASVANEWALKGAINAGFAVFLYLDDLAKHHGAVAKPTYDHCEQRQP
jgi:hypothetical protein